MSSPTVTPALLIAAGASPANAALYAPHLAASCTRRGVATASDTANLLAEVMNESGNLTCAHEIMTYTTAARICSVFPSHFATLRAALPYVRQPKKLGDLVYARLGGYDGRGDGLGELTGLATFQRYASDIGLPAGQVEGYMTTPAGAADSAVWYFVQFGCRGLADPKAVRCRWAGMAAGSTPIGWPNVLRLYTLLARALGVRSQHAPVPAASEADRLDAEFDPAG